MGLRTRRTFFLIGMLQMIVFVCGNPPIDTPGRCANARKPAHGDVKCCIDTGNIFDEVAAHSGGKSSSSESGGSSKGHNVYTCSYSCNKGYKLIGPPVLECPIPSVTDNPTCALVECNTLPTIDHGSLICDNSFLYGSECQYTCAQGFNISGGNDNLTCGSDGLWSGVVPTCEPVRCPALADPNHGSVSCPNGRSFKSDCRYNCDDRYTLDGSGIATCTKTGEWSDEAPKCELGECSPLPLLVHGSLSCSVGWDRGSRCIYSCHRGFSLTGGNFLLTCRFNGFWRGDIPTCQPDKEFISTTHSSISTESDPTTDKGSITTLFSNATSLLETTTDYRTANPNFTTYVTSGNSTVNSTEEFATYDFLVGNGLKRIVAPGAATGNSGSGSGSGDSGISTAGIISIVAVAIILIAVTIGLFAAYHSKKPAQEGYGHL